MPLLYDAMISLDVYTSDHFFSIKETNRYVLIAKIQRYTKEMSCKGIPSV
jgi:hypothetical protein